MKKTTGMKPESYNTSGSVMKKRVEQGLPHQALTLFAPVGMAEDLTKVQPILCKEVKTEKETISAVPFMQMQSAERLHSSNNHVRRKNDQSRRSMQ